jgi:general secretion pathway protein B
MSYILEALKKSQQERELGQVPTLDRLPFPSKTASARPGPWIMSAVGLAMLAFIIALYSALRGTTSVSQSETVSVEQGLTVAEPPAETVQGPTASPAEEAVAATAPPLAPESEAKVGSETSAKLDPTSAGTTAAPPAPRAPPVAARAPERPAVRRERSSEEKIPEDLRRDIEAFKDEVRRERAGSKSKGGSKAKNKPSAPDVPPQQLRLPPDVRERLPAFLMSAHVYSKDPAKRWVLINSLRVREKERSREGVAVEEILPDGAVLSYEGHRFFKER